MGLTIHYSIAPPVDWPWHKVVAVLEQARRAATALPFCAVDPRLRELRGKQIVPQRSDGEADRWFKIQSGRRVCSAWHPGASMTQYPAKLIGFNIDVADGSEPMNVLVASFPEHRWTPRPLRCNPDAASAIDRYDYLPDWKSVLDGRDERQSLPLIRGVLKKWQLRRLRCRPAGGKYVGLRAAWDEAIEIYSVQGVEHVRAGIIRGPYRSHRRGYGPNRACLWFKDHGRCALGNSGQTDLWFQRRGDLKESLAVFNSAEFKLDIRKLVEGEPTVTPPWTGGRSFCKTQYASDPACGGTANFIKAHLSVLALLEQMQGLGFTVTVKDEGGFWEKRDIEALCREVGQWNGMIAALAGAMNDALRTHGGELSLESPIQQFSNFEQLEAQGQPAISALLKAFCRTAVPT